MEVLSSQLTLIGAAMAGLAVTALAIFRDVATRRSATAHVS
jgi:hypothetical protein